MKQKSERERQALITEMQRSGLSRPKFCHQRGISYTTMCSWQNARSSPKSVRALRRVEVSPLSLFADSAIAEVALPNGARVRVMRGCGQEDFSMILEASGKCGS